MKINIYSKEELEMFKNKKWLVSEGINEKLSIEIQLFIWKQLQSLKIKNIKAFQQFEFYIDRARNKLKFYHSQDEFLFLSEREFPWDPELIDEDCIVCVYDDGESTRMSFIQEF